MDPNTIKRLKEILEELIKIDPIKSLHLEELIGEFGFKEAQGILSYLQILCKKLLSFDFMAIPLSFIENLSRSAGTTLQSLREIQNFRTKDPRSRDTLTEEFKRCYHDFLQDSLPILSYYTIDEQSIQKFEYLLKRAEEINTKINEKYEQTDSESKRILDNLEDAAKKTGITKHSTIFATQAKEHKTISVLWLIATIALSGFMLGIIYYLFKENPFEELLKDPVNSLQLVQFSILKIVAFSILSYLIILCIKNYNAHRHNYIINIFKKNALATFQTFIDSTSDDQIKNTILLETTRAIFSQNSSGYLKHESDDSSPNRIIEVVRDIKSVVDGK